MAQQLEELAAQKSIVCLASTLDNNSIPWTHFQLLKPEVQGPASNQWLCCHTISLHAEGTVLTSLLLIFDVVACIMEEDCFLTTEGDLSVCEITWCCEVVVISTDMIPEGHYNFCGKLSSVWILSFWGLGGLSSACGREFGMLAGFEITCRASVMYLLILYQVTDHSQFGYSS